MLFIDIVQRFRTLMLASVVICICAGLWFSQYLDLDLSLSSRFLKDNPQIEVYQAFQNEFGPEPLLSVVWEGQGRISKPENLARLKELTALLKQISHIESVMSVVSLMENYRNTVSSRLTHVEDLPLVKKLLLGKEGKKTVLLLTPSVEAISPGPGRLLVRDVERRVSNFLGKGERAFVSGPLAMQSKAIEYSRRDLFRAGLFILIVILLLFGFSFKTPKAVFSAILITAFTIFGVSGILALSHQKLSQFALMAFPILAVISLQDAVHLLQNFNFARREGLEPDLACHEMVRSCLTPCLWTTLTTSAGFASLIFSNIEQIRSIGLVVLTGAPIALVGSFLIVPALFVNEKGACARDETVKPRWNFPCDLLISWISGYASWIIVFLFLCTMLSATAFRFVRADFTFPGIFKKGVPFQSHLEEVDTYLAGAASFEIMLKIKDGDTFWEPEKFKLIKSVQLAMSLTAPVARTLSPLDIALTIHQLKTGKSSYSTEMFYDRDALLNEIGPIGSGPLKNWVSPDFKKVRIHIRLITGKQRYYDRMMDALKYLKGKFDKAGVEVSWSGFSLLYKDMEKIMLTELISSFTTAFIVITLMMIILLRSLLWGVLTMVPNLLPLCITVGIMGWMGVGFSLGLIILPAVGLGLVVDDTIHIVWHLKQMRAKGSGSKAAVKQVFRTTGPALILTTAIIVSGFASLATSAFVSNVQLSIFMPILLLIALIIDLVGVPAVLFLKESPAKRSL